MSDAKPLIAHIVHRFDYGGLENGVVNLINGMNGSGFRHAVIALTEATAFRARLKGNVPVYALGKRAGNDFAAYGRLFRLLRKLRPAVVHSRSIGALDCVAVARLAGVPIRIHGEHGWDVHDPNGTNRKYRLMRRAVSPLAYRYVAVSEDLRQWLTKVVGVPDRKVSRIYNGVDTRRFRPRRDRDGRAVLPFEQLAPDSIVIGTVTRFSRIKDPMNVVEAFLDARAAAPLGSKVRLVMIGDGELREPARARLEEAGAADAAWLPGSRDDVAELLNAFDIFVLGSLKEGISNTVLEAMASGLPVIATAAGGNAELVVPGRTGELVPPADPSALAAAITRYAENADLRALHGRLARERAVSLFSLASMIEGYRHLYEAACARAMTPQRLAEGGGAS